MPIEAVTVFCGAKPGLAEQHLRAAGELGRTLARAGLDVVYGGASVGLMGPLADEALSAGGRVVGVIPESLHAHEGATHPRLTELHVVSDMHRRKAVMADLGDAFVALPGGLGTVEEFFEVLTWSHLGLHGKPCVLLDSGGYYRHLHAFLSDAVREGFVTAGTARRLVVCRRVDEVLAALGHPRAHTVVTERG
ncbi:TIGR00730 family Rossman fold protein [Streptomyces sp. CA-249302]|uniref:LOG family protein n=1 Tax=Streptomyces sp. CA-249302 TaxID=3240058 RepID=UPI003D8D39A1